MAGETIMGPMVCTVLPPASWRPRPLPSAADSRWPPLQLPARSRVSCRRRSRPSSTPPGPLSRCWPTTQSWCGASLRPVPAKDLVGLWHSPQPTDHRPQTTDHSPQTTDHRPQTTQTTDHRPHGPQTTDHRPQTADHAAPAPRCVQAAFPGTPPWCGSGTCRPSSPIPEVRADPARRRHDLGALPRGLSS